MISRTYITLSDFIFQRSFIELRRSFFPGSTQPRLFSWQESSRWRWNIQCFGLVIDFWIISPNADFDEYQCQRCGTDCCGDYDCSNFIGVTDHHKSTHPEHQFTFFTGADWTETWKCHVCGTIFSFQTSNF